MIGVCFISVGGESLRRFGKRFQSKCIFSSENSSMKQSYPQPSQGWLNPFETHPNDSTTMRPQSNFWTCRLEGPSPYTQFSCTFQAPEPVPGRSRGSWPSPRLQRGFPKTTRGRVLEHLKIPKLRISPRAVFGQVSHYRQPGDGPQSTRYVKISL